MLVGAATDAIRCLTGKPMLDMCCWIRYLVVYCLASVIYASLHMNMNEVAPKFSGQSQKARLYFVSMKSSREDRHSSFTSSNVQIRMTSNESFSRCELLRSTHRMWSIWGGQSILSWSRLFVWHEESLRHMEIANILWVRMVANLFLHYPSQGFDIWVVWGGQV